ncbi:MAG: prepilin peptidase [Alphaproteobacteria bacterium]|nr:prepilin peptidase [Alphaproteobacteria bacterium]
MLAMIVLSLFPLAMAYAAISDLATMTLPNWLSVGLLVLFLALALGFGLPYGRLGADVGLGLVVLVAGIGCFAMGWVGGGDVKLAAAIAIWMGTDQILSFLLLMSVFGGGLAVLLLLFRRLPLPALLATRDWATRLHAPREGVPYGVALALAALTLYPQTALFGAILAG